MSELSQVDPIFLKRLHRDRLANRISGYFLAFIFGGILIGLTALMIFAAVTQHRIDSRIDRGLKTNGKVIGIDQEHGTVHYAFEWEGKSYHGKSPVTQKKLNQYQTGEKIDIQFDPEDPYFSRAMDSKTAIRFPYFSVLILMGCLGVPPIILFILSYRNRKQGEYKIAYIQALGQLEIPSPRALLLELERKIGNTFLVQTGRELFSDNVIHCWDFHEAMATGSTGFNRWFLKQKKLPDPEEYFSRYAAMHEVVFDPARKFDPLPAPIPDSIEPLMRENYSSAAYDALFRLAESAFPQEDSESILTLDLSRLDREAERVRTLQAKKVERRVEFRLLNCMLNKPDRGKPEALKKVGLDEESLPKIHPLLFNTPNDSGTTDLLNSAEAVRLVNGMLYLFYMKPWKWEVINREFLYQRQDGVFVRLHLVLDPEKELRIECRALQTSQTDTHGTGIPTGIQTGEFEGVPYLYSYRQTFGERPANLRVVIPGKDLDRMLAGEIPAEHPKSGAFFWKKSVRAFIVERRKPENCFDFVYRILALLSHASSGIFMIDMNFRAKAEKQDRSFAENYFSYPNQNKALKDFFQEGYDEVSYSEGYLRAAGSPDALKDDPDITYLQSIVKRLALMAKDIPTHLYEKPLFGQPRSLMTAFLLFGGIIVTGLISVGFMFWIQQRYSILDSDPFFFKSLWFSLPVGLPLFFILCRFFMRGISHRKFMYWMCLVVLTLYGNLMFTLIVSSIGEYINGAWDNSEPSVHVVDVLEKDLPTADCVNVESWRTGHEKEKIELSAEQHSVVIPGESKLRIKTKPGRLGYEWIAEIKIEPENKSQTIEK